MAEHDADDAVEQAAAALVPALYAKPPAQYLDGIPVGNFRDRVCYVPLFGGGYFLRDPEKRDRAGEWS